MISVLFKNLFLLCVTILISELNAQNITYYKSLSNSYQTYSSANGRPRSEGCDSTVTQKEGWIFSPNFPQNYDNYVQCNYHIFKYGDDVCSIELILTDFDVESTPDCSADYLDLGDGSTRMCGTLIADTRKIISFPSNRNEIKMTFNSNQINNRKGFMAKVRQLRNSCAPYVLNRIPTPMHGSESVPEVFHRQPIYLSSYCDIYIGEVMGDLRSPGYPYGYHSNQSCVYTIRRAASDICKVELIFHQFDISSDGKQCDTDYVELPDRSRVCGSLPVQNRVYPFSRSSDYLMVRFKSDRYVDKHVTGFWIEVRQSRNSCDAKSPQNAVKCDQTLSSELTTIHSPNYPHFYGASQQCVYFVEPLDKNVCEYELEFLSFNLESSRDYSGKCNKDFILLPDQTRLCGFFSGKKILSFPKFRDRIGMFYFTSDEKREERGFQIRVKQLANSCFNPSAYGFRISPSSVSTTPTPYIVTPGYAIQANNTFYNCDRLITAQIDVITSPNYPHNYPPTTRCIYTFLKSVPNVCQIRLKILDLDLEHTRDCTTDYLLLEPTGQKFCGQFIQAEDKIVNFPSFSNELRVIFNSDRQTSRPGFRIRTEQILNSCSNPVIETKPVVEGESLIPVAIQQPFVAEKPFTPTPDLRVKPTITPQICASSSAIVSTFQSDNYPLAYNAYTNCVYRVFRASRGVCRIEVDFQDFDVGVEDLTHKLCINGYVEINHVKYCGRRQREKVIIDFGPEKSEITFRFHTESAVRYGGFRIVVRQLDNNCQHNHISHEFSPASTESCNKMQFSEKSLQILSPHYETGTYQPFLDCQYIIRKMSFDVCALEVRFDTFALEESKSCVKDYLQIGSIKLCGKVPFGDTRTYEFISDEMLIKFHTDGEGSDTGYMILVKQIKC